MTHIISATDQTFDSIVQNNPALIVDFWAPTCGPCRQMEPGLEKIAQNYGAQLKILKAPFIYGMSLLCVVTGLVHLAFTIRPAQGMEESEGGTL